MTSPRPNPMCPFESELPDLQPAESNADHSKPAECNVIVVVRTVVRSWRDNGQRRSPDARPVMLGPAGQHCPLRAN
jgi:hypothetical protein